MRQTKVIKSNSLTDHQDTVNYWLKTLHSDYRSKGIIGVTHTTVGGDEYNVSYITYIDYYGKQEE